MISKGRNFDLASIYLGSLYWRLDMLSQHQEDSVGRYRILTYLDAGFLQMFLCERFRSYAPDVDYGKKKKRHPHGTMLPLRPWV